MLFVTTKRILLLFFFVEIIYCQDFEPGTFTRRCARGCVAPQKCQKGYFGLSSYRPAAYDYCCYTKEDSYTYDSSQTLLLDCRFRNLRNFRKTKILSNVEALDISFTKIYHQTPMLRDDFLQYFENLKSLTLSTSRVTILPPDFLSNNAALKHLTLSWNRIRELPESLFEHNTELTVIDLSNNRITALHPDLFRNNPDIETLLLRNNKLKILPPGSFRFLPALQYLDVSDNMSMLCISGQVFSHNRKLAEVNLEKIGVRIYSGLQKRFCKVRTEGCTGISLLYLQLSRNSLMHRSRGEFCLDQ